MIENENHGDQLKVDSGESVRRLLDHTLEHFHAIVQGSDDAIISKTLDSIVTSWNPGAESIFGYTESEMLGKPILALIPPELIDEEDFFLQKMLDGEHIHHFETERLHKNGSRIVVSVTLSPIRDRAGKVVGVSKIARDITEHKRIEEHIEALNRELEARVAARTQDLADVNAALQSTNLELKRTQNELIRGEKMSALGVLIAGVSHEMNTPLGNSLTVSSSLHHELTAFELEVEAGRLTKHRLKEFNLHLHIGLDLLLKNLARAIEQILHFKEVSVDQASERRRIFNLKTVIEDNVSVLQPQFAHTPHRIEVDIAGLIMMDSYPGAIGQILANLVLNALIHGFSEAMHGVVTISAAMEGTSHVQLVCSDNGKGIAEENLSRIFDPFFTTRMGQGGSGLGLNIVFNLVTLNLHGTIKVDSVVGHFTRFTVVIPLNADQ